MGKKKKYENVNKNRNERRKNIQSKLVQKFT